MPQILVARAAPRRSTDAKMRQFLLLCLAAASAFQAPQRRPQTPPPRAASVALEQTLRSLTVARTPAELKEAAKLCGESFPGSTEATHYGVLVDPGSLANVFFDARASASVALVRENDAEPPLACVQLVPCAVRREASAARSGAPVLWVQCLCVAPGKRRTGAARELMAWCEAEAAAAAESSGAAACEIWLAVRDDNVPARTLYESMGFTGDGESRRSHVILAKAVPAAAAGGPRGPAASFDVLSGNAAGPLDVLGAAARESGPSLVFALVAALGASALVAPFFYGGLGAPPPVAMAGALVGTPFQALGDAALGAGAAVAAEAASGAGSRDEEDVLAALEANPSLAGQKAALWRVTGAAQAPPALALTAIVGWQLAAALSEELYYRALLQNGAAQALTKLSSSPALGETVALAATTALFAVAHAGWVDETGAEASASMSEDDMRGDWLKETAPFGLLFGALFAATGHRLLAPVVCHTALNAYWSSVDAAKLRAAPERAKLAAIFDAQRPPDMPR